MKPVLAALCILSTVVPIALAEEGPPAQRRGWARTGSLTTPRSGAPAVALLDGGALVAGGLGQEPGRH